MIYKNRLVLFLYPILNIFVTSIFKPILIKQTIHPDIYLDTLFYYLLYYVILSFIYLEYLNCLRKENNIQILKNVIITYLFFPFTLIIRQIFIIFVVDIPINLLFFILAILTCSKVIYEKSNYSKR